jgi:hypothetical protein
VTQRARIEIVSDREREEIDHLVGMPTEEMSAEHAMRAIFD